MSYLSMWTVAAFLICLQVRSAVAASSIDTMILGNRNENDRKGIVSLELIPHHVELNRRQRERHLLEDDDVGEESYGRRREEAVQVGALFEGYGTHYVDLWIGSPPQRQTVIVDTGSGITAFPCSGCKECGVPNYHIDRLFIEKESSTFETATCKSSADCVLARSTCQGNSCKVSMAYAEGSRWNAYEGVDRCYVAGPHEIPLVTSQGATIEGDDLNPRHAADLSFDMAFGCQTLVTGLFKTQLADGIMGMSNQLSTYWGQMFEAGQMGSDKQFALCFSRPPDPSREGVEAGALTLGGVDTRLHLSPMVFTPSASGGRQSFFSVKIRRMMLRQGDFGDSALSNDDNPNKGVTVLNLSDGVLNKGGVIVDSGTTDTYWNSGISVEFQKVFKKLAGRAHSNKAMKLSDDEFRSLPTILFQLYSDDGTNSHISDMFHTAGLAGALDQEHKSDVILAIPASHYMERNADKNSYTSRFYPTERSGSVFGANAMMGHDILFDIDNNRIGWAESACNYTNTVEQNGYKFEITGELKAVEEAETNGEGSASASAPAGCESYKSGSKCPKAEGCSWYWGKCTKDSDVPADTPSPTSASRTATSLPTIIDNVMKESEEEVEKINDGKMATKISQILDGNEAIVVGLVVALSTVCCLIYCCCCRRDGSSSSGNYSRASVDPATIEMTNGNGTIMPIDSHKESFSDEPSVNRNGGSVASGSDSSSKFRDRPNDEPEFEGDFA